MGEKPGSGDKEKAPSAMPSNMSKRRGKAPAGFWVVGMVRAPTANEN